MSLNYTNIKKMIPTGWRRMLKPLYQRFHLRGFTHSQFVPLSVAGERVEILIDPVNGALDQYIYIHHEWEQAIAAVLQKILTEGSVFVDVGANIGAFAVPLAQRVAPTGRVWAFEPHPRLVQQMEQSLKKNNLDNVTVVAAACGREEGEGTLHISQTNIGGSSLLQHVQASEEIPLTITTLDSVLAAEPQIDVIKIDVEGYELEVLQGAAAVLKKHESQIVLEFSPGLYAQRDAEMGENILALLKNLGYHCFEIERQLEVVDADQYLKELGARQVNLWCRKRL